MTKGTRPGHVRTPSRTEEEGRVCAFDGCKTKLSVYNQGAYCWQHSDVVFPNYRGKRLRTDRA